MTNRTCRKRKGFFPLPKGALLRPFLIKMKQSEIDHKKPVCKIGSIIGKVNECDPNDYVECEAGNIIGKANIYEPNDYISCEAGNIIDQMGSIFVMVFMFVMVLVFAGYSKMVMMRINIDTVTKSYLYQMEEEGCLTAEMQQYMKEELRDIGVNYGTDGDAISFAGTSNLGDDQAPYGSRITLQCSMSFPNPMYETIGQEKKGDAWFTLPGLARTLNYTVKMTATSKW